MSASPYLTWPPASRYFEGGLLSFSSQTHHHHALFPTQTDSRTSCLLSSSTLASSLTLRTIPNLLHLSLAADPHPSHPNEAFISCRSSTCARNCDFPPAAVPLCSPTLRHPPDTVAYQGGRHVDGSTIMNRSGAETSG